MKKFVALLLAMVCLLSVLAGCSRKPKDDPSEPGTSSGSAENSNFNPTGLPIVKEPVTIKVMARVDPNASLDYENMSFFKMVSEKTNMNAKWSTTRNADWETKKNLMFAGNDYPDVLFGGVTHDDEEKYGVQQQILIPLDQYITEEYMPNLCALLESNPEYRRQMVATDGHIYSIPRCWEIGYDSTGHMFINKKWLDKLNLPVPKTLEEFENTLRAFTTQDPNGNNKKDEIGLDLLFEDEPSGLQNLVGLFGQLDTTDHLILENDKVVFSAAQDTYRKSMEWVHKAYQDNLIDPEAFAQDKNTFFAKVKSGNVGVFLGWRLQFLGLSYDGIEEDYICMAPPAAEGVNAVWRKKESTLIPYGSSITINNEHVAETIRWLDYQLDPDIAFQGRDGILGTYQELDENGRFKMLPKEDGTRWKNTEVMTDAPGPGAMYFITKDVMKEKYSLSPAHLEKYPFCDIYRPYLCEQSPVLISLGRLDQEDQHKIARMETDIQKFVAESTMDFIAHGVTDSKWQSYLDTLNDMHVDEYVAMKQKAYDGYNIKN